MGFRGGIMEIPIGFDGMIGSQAHPLVTPTRLIQTDNIEYGSGVIRKEGGADKYNSTAVSGSAGILGGWDWWPDASTQRMVVVTDTSRMFKDSGGATFPDTLTTAIAAPTDIPIFVEGGKEAAANNKKLFMLTGTNAVHVLSADAATTYTISGAPADWTGTNQPVTGCNHAGRFWAAGNANDPHRVYYSSTTNHELFSGATSGTIAVFPGEGMGIVSIVSFKGLLVVFKRPAGIYVINTTSNTVADWAVARLSKEIGLAGPGAACVIPDDILFLDAGGEFNLISAIQEFGNIRSKNLSTVLELTDFLHDNINFSAINKTQSVFYADRREAHFFVPSSGSTRPNMRMVFDLKRELPRFRTSARDSGHSIWLRDAGNNIKPYYGDDDGFVWEMDKTDKDKDSTGYNGMFQTPHLDFSHIDPKLATKRKSGMFLEVLTQPQGNWNLSVGVYWDGDLTQAVQFNMGSAGAALGTFTLGTDALAQDQILNRKKRITGSGRRLSLQGSNSGSGQDFAVSKFLVHYKVNDERE